MNWLGIDLRAVVAALAGAVVAFSLVRSGAAHGVDLGWTVGLVVALAVAATARTAATMRGFFVGTVAVWTLAAARTLPSPLDGVRPSDLFTSFAHYHDRLDVLEGVEVLVTAVVGVALGMRSLRPGAKQRLAGT